MLRKEWKDVAREIGADRKTLKCFLRSPVRLLRGRDQIESFMIYAKEATHRIPHENNFMSLAL